MKNFVCSNCGYIGKQKTYTKGSFIIELFLWLMLIVPGIIYSLWRLTTKFKACPKCRAPNMIPIDTPRGQQLSEQFKKTDN